MMRQYLNLLLIFCILLLIACSASQSKSSESVAEGILINSQNFQEITGIEWHLTRMIKDKNPITLVKDSKTTFACDENGRVTGKATLNRYSGDLKLQEDGEIIWSKAFIMTRMAGPPELMQQEADFTQTLMETSRMYLKDSKLVLMSEDQSYLLEFDQTK